ncbi:hypothetical protein [Kribbella endophytica]
MKVELSEDEALVLSDWLDRVIAREDFARLVDDRAVWSPLLTISGKLETQLPMIFSSSYGEQLNAARTRLLVEVGDFGEVGTTSSRGPTVRDSLLRLIAGPRVSLRAVELAGLALAADAVATALTIEADGSDLTDPLPARLALTDEVAATVRHFEQQDLTIRELETRLAGMVATLDEWTQREPSGSENS